MLLRLDLTVRDTNKLLNFEYRLKQTWVDPFFEIKHAYLWRKNNIKKQNKYLNTYKSIHTKFQICFGLLGFFQSGIVVHVVHPYSIRLTICNILIYLLIYFIIYLAGQHVIVSCKVLRQIGRCVIMKKPINTYVKKLRLEIDGSQTCRGSSDMIGFGAVRGNDAPLHSIARTVCVDSFT